MASPAELGPLLPDTLPEDFGEWDSGESQPAVPVSTIGIEPAMAPAPRQAASILEPQVIVTPNVEVRRDPVPAQTSQPKDQEAFLRQLHAIGNGLPTGLERPSRPTPQAQQPSRTVKEPAFAPARSNGADMNGSRNSSSAAPQNGNGTRAAQTTSPASASTDDEAFLRQLREIGSALNSQPVAAAQSRSAARATEEVAPAHARSTSDEGRRWPSKPVLATAVAGGATAVGFPSFHSDLAEAGEENPLRKKWMMIAAVTLASLVIVVFLGMRMFSPSKPSLAKQTVTVVQPTVTETEPIVDTRKPSPSTQLGANKTPATVQDAMAAAAPVVAEAHLTPSPEAAQNMNDQLAASPKISRDIGQKTQEDAPPPAAFAADGMSGSSSVNPVFGKQSHPTIAYVAPAPVAISAGVAGGLLIHRTEPLYPQIAKATRVEGTVVIQATVTKSGSLANLHVIGGPAMLRQAALDAVTTWRYKPYLVNNEPTDVQTTVSVVFKLGQ